DITTHYPLYSAPFSVPATCASGIHILPLPAALPIYSGLTNGTTYFYRLCATDNAGTTSSGATASTAPQAPDTTAPAGSLTINAGGAYTASTTVTLALAATDTVGVTGYYLATSATPPAASAVGWTTVKIGRASCRASMSIPGA